MKTKLLILSLLLATTGVWAQNTFTNRDEMLRHALRHSYTNGFGRAPAAVMPAATNTLPIAPLAAPVDASANPGVPTAPDTSVPMESSAPRPISPVVASRSTQRAEPSDMDKPFEGTINFAGADLNSVLQIYAVLVNRTLLRAANLPSPPIVLKTQTALTKREAIQALDVVLGLNGIAVINFGDKFAKVVPVSQANQEAGSLSYQDADQLPEMGQYTTHVVQLTYAKPSEVISVLQPFQKMPNAAIAIDSSGILVLRDYTENVKRMLEMIKQVDVSVPAEIESEVIPIKYALADDMASALNSVSSGTSATTVGAGGGSAAGRGASSSTGFNGARATTTYGGVGTPQATGSRFGGQANTNPNLSGSGLNTGTLGSQGAAAGASGGPGGAFGDRIRAIINRASGGGGSAGDFQILGQTKI
ncbi:MAG TPA: secretin N-terminal domain-containing protein, partial [Verrucomicrobiae bacterium]|nr:secretin N-terminal domain-containing protein [Verrucomicrobiae bacterium]